MHVRIVVMRRGNLPALLGGVKCGKRHIGLRHNNCVVFCEQQKIAGWCLGGQIDSTRRFGQMEPSGIWRHIRMRTGLRISLIVNQSLEIAFYLAELRSLPQARSKQQLLTPQYMPKLMLYTL